MAERTAQTTELHLPFDKGLLAARPGCRRENPSRAFASLRAHGVETRGARVPRHNIVRLRTTTAWTGLGQALFGLGLLARRATWRELRTMLRDKATVVLRVNAANVVINLGGLPAQRYALLLAPLSLVQAIAGPGRCWCSCSAADCLWWVRRSARQTCRRRTCCARPWPPVSIAVRAAHHQPIVFYWRHRQRLK